VQPSSSPSRVKRSLPLTTKSSSEKSPNFLETAICRAPQTQRIRSDCIREDEPHLALEAAAFEAVCSEARASGQVLPFIMCINS